MADSRIKKVRPAGAGAALFPARQARENCRPGSAISWTITPAEAPSCWLAYDRSGELLAKRNTNHTCEDRADDNQQRMLGNSLKNENGIHSPNRVTDERSRGFRTIHSTFGFEQLGLVG
jgi:hypothetical protein